MVFRMAALADLPGPSIECGQRIIEDDNADDASSEEEVGEPVSFRTRLGMSGYYNPGAASPETPAAGSAAGASGEATASAAGGAAEPGAAASAAEAAKDDDFDQE